VFTSPDFSETSTTRLKQLHRVAEGVLVEAARPPCRARRRYTSSVGTSAPRGIPSGFVQLALQPERLRRRDEAVQARVEVSEKSGDVNTVQLAREARRDYVLAYARIGKPELAKDEFAKSSAGLRA